MGISYERIDRSRRDKRDRQIHPIWRGIGCILLVLIPVMAFAGTSLILDANTTNNWFIVPYELQGPLQYPYLYAKLAGTLLLSVLGFGVLVSFYALIYSIIGPPKYGPLDAPPPRKVKRRRK